MKGKVLGIGKREREREIGTETEKERNGCVKSLLFLFVSSVFSLTLNHIISQFKKEKPSLSLSVFLVSKNPPFSLSSPAT